MSTSARYPAAYLRRSSISADSPGDASREAQLAAVRSMCGPDVTVYTDWGISGQKADRPEYLRLKADIAAGRVGSLCAYSLSRLGRSARELLTLVDLCAAHGVTIRTSVESLDTSTAMGKAMLTVMAAFAQLEADVARERQASALEARRARGDDLSAPYGWRLERQADGAMRRVRNDAIDLSALVGAFREAGSVLGACRLLEQRGVPAPRGGTRWATSALTRILEREAPDLLPRRTSTGMRTPTSAILAQLLRCPAPGCGVMLTPNAKRGQYYCRLGPRDTATHPRYTVTERLILPWVKAEAARLRVPYGEGELDGIGARRDAIAERLGRANELYIEGAIDRAKLDAAKARAARDTAALEATEALVTIPEALDWSWAPARINEVLRSMWRHVELDAGMTPVRAEWVLPGWRAA